MPYPNEHACRLQDPDKFETLRRDSEPREHDGKPYYVIYGKVDDDAPMEEQSYRYPKGDWDADEARTHCEDHDGTFEAAAESDSADPAETPEGAPAPGRRSGQMERRTISAGELRIMERAGEGARIQGYGALFGVWTDELGWFREKIEPGAFTRCLKGDPDVRCLWQHNPEYVFGRTVVSGTLELREDEKGLFYDCAPPHTTWAQDALETIRRGDVTQSSFAFTVPEGGDKWVEEDGVVSRTVMDADLWDVSPVTFPAYPDTVVGVRTLMEASGNDPARMMAMLAQVRGAPGIALPREGWNQALAAMMGTPGATQDEEAAAALDLMRRRMEMARRAVL